MAQVVSLGGIILGCAGLAWLYLFKRSLPDVAPPLLPAAVAPTSEADQEMVAPGTEGEEGDRESS
jgi:hypothetical protein